DDHRKDARAQKGKRHHALPRQNRHLELSFHAHDASDEYMAGHVLPPTHLAAPVQEILLIHLPGMKAARGTAIAHEVVAVAGEHASPALIAAPDKLRIRASTALLGEAYLLEQGPFPGQGPAGDQGSGGLAR